MRSLAWSLAAFLLLQSPVARADDEDLVTRIRTWAQNLGKPAAPAPPAPPPSPGAQDTFTVNPVAMEHGELGVEFERAVFSGLSLAVQPEAGWSSSSALWQLSLSGTLVARFFVLGSAPSGIYFGPAISGLYLRTRTNGVLSTGYGLGLGGEVGWTIVFFNKFTASAGFACLLKQVPDPAAGVDATRSEVSAVPRLNFGVAF